jgi:hypothetical protein
MRSTLQAAIMLSLAATNALALQADTTAGWTPVLVVRAVASRPEGTQASQISGDRKLVRGELAPVIWSGRSLCTIGIGGGDPTAAPANVWKMTGDYLGEQNGRHQIRVTSGFTRLAGSGSTATNTQTLSLREGDSVVLDALTDRADATCPVRIVTFEARLAMQAADPALARSRYTVDMWLVHTDPDGKEQREHLVMNVDGSTIMPFMFNRLAFPIPQVDARQGNAEAVIQLTGALRLRPQGDGTVILDLETNRFLFGLERPDAPLRSSPSAISMTFKTREGETVAVNFPPPSSGFSSIALSKDGTTAVAVRPGTVRLTPSPGAVTVKEGKLILYTFEFFRGHSTRLLITLKPLR